MAAKKKKTTRAKKLDPESVVRESEARTVGNTRTRVKKLDPKSVVRESEKRRKKKGARRKK